MGKSSPPYPAHPRGISPTKPVALGRIPARAPRKRSPIAIGVRTLLYLAHRYPVPLLTGVALVMISCAGLSMRGLLQVDPVSGDRNPSAIQSDAPIARSLESSSTTALTWLNLAEGASGWLLTAAVAGGIAFVALSPRSQAPRSRPKPTSRSRTGSPKSPARTLPPKNQRIPARSARSQSLPPRTARNRSSAMAMRAPATATVTVLPPEASHPLDWEGHDLAAMMDIRHRKSFSSYL